MIYFFPSFVFNDCRSVSLWIEKCWQLSPWMVDANASWMLMLAGGGGKMYWRRQCEILLRPVSWRRWLNGGDRRGRGERGRHNVSDMNTEVLEGQGAGLVGCGGGFQPKILFLFKVISLKAKELKHYIVFFILNNRSENGSKFHLWKHLKHFWNISNNETFFLYICFYFFF